MPKLLSTAYFPPVSYFAAIAQEMEGLIKKGDDRKNILPSPLSSSIIFIETCENYQKQSYRNNAASTERMESRHSPSLSFTKTELIKILSLR